MRIEKKILPQFFEEVKNGTKKFELRVADFECKPGDVLVLREWNNEKKEYTGRVIEKKITYVAKTKEFNLNSKEDIEKYGFLVIGFK